MGCIDQHRAFPIVHLNASALSTNSLWIPLYSHKLSSPFPSLIDSGLTHCFLDVNFVEHNKIAFSKIPPRQLQLFDGTIGSVITRKSVLPIQFPTGETLDIEFLVTPLDSASSAVLGYD
jgi:hypothetical protein